MFTAMFTANFCTKESHATEKMLGRDAAALAGRLAAGDPAFDWQPLATFMAAASAPDETTEAAATNEARAFAVPEEQEEEEARAAAAPPALRSQDEAPGSSAAAPIVFDDDEEDATPGGTAPLPPAQAVAEGQLVQPSSSSAPLRRDPAAVPAARAGTRPPSRLDEAAWGAYVYKNNKTETWRATWGFTGDTKKYGLKVKKDATILGAKSMLSKEAAAVKRYEALLLYGEHERIPWDLHELHLKRRALDSLADRALLAEVRAVVAPSHGFPNPFGEWEMVQRLAKRPCHELAQLVVLAAKLAPGSAVTAGRVALAIWIRMLGCRHFGSLQLIVIQRRALGRILGSACRLVITRGGLGRVEAQKPAGIEWVEQFFAHARKPRQRLDNIAVNEDVFTATSFGHLCLREQALLTVHRFCRRPLRFRI